MFTLNKFFPLINMRALANVLSHIHGQSQYFEFNSHLSKSTIYVLIRIFNRFCAYTSSLYTQSGSF